jgi:hypothetical protein
VTHQHGGFRVRQHFVCDTAEHNGGYSAAPMRCHDDEIAAPILGHCNDGLIGLRVLHLNRVAGHTSLLGRIAHTVQHARSVLLDLLGMFGEFLKSVLCLRF